MITNDGTEFAQHFTNFFEPEDVHKVDSQGTDEAILDVEIDKDVLLYSGSESESD